MGEGHVTRSTAQGITMYMEVLYGGRPHHKEHCTRHHHVYGGPLWGKATSQGALHKASPCIWRSSMGVDHITRSTVQGITMYMVVLYGGRPRHKEHCTRHHHVYGGPLWG